MTEYTKSKIAVTGLLLILTGVVLRFTAPIWIVYIPAIPGMILLCYVRRKLGWILATAGACCNFLAIAANHGKMPVFGMARVYDNSHFVTTTAHLSFICDYINVGIGIASPGDLLWFVGFLLCVSGVDL